jgi:hypothetical protein
MLFNHFFIGGIVLNYFDKPITPQAILGPELPFFRD